MEQDVVSLRANVSACVGLQQHNEQLANNMEFALQVLTLQETCTVMINAHRLTHNRATSERWPAHAVERINSAIFELHNMRKALDVVRP